MVEAAAVSLVRLAATADASLPGCAFTQAGLELLKSHVFIHLGEDNGEKMQLLVFMLQKLYALANGQCSEVTAKWHMERERVLFQPGAAGALPDRSRVRSLVLLHKCRGHSSRGVCCAQDNPDALIHHEILLPGHLLAKYLKEKLEDVLIAAQLFVRRLCESAPESVDLSNEAFVRKARMARPRGPGTGQEFELQLKVVM